MERLILKDLLQWKKSKHRKPLILKGVRQVGKTWVLKESVAVIIKILDTLTLMSTRNTSNFLKRQRTLTASCKT